MHRTILVLSIVIAGWAGQAFTTSAHIHSADGDTIAHRTGWSASFFPVLFYGPDLGLGGGGGTVISHVDSGNPRPPTISTVAFYTTKNKALAVVSPSFTARRGAYEIEAALKYSSFPSSFYGIGVNVEDDDEEAYTLEEVGLEIELYRRVCCELRAGLQYEIAHDGMREFDEGGVIASRALIGARGGRRAGLGPAAAWDSRDNRFFPTRGGWYQVRGRWYRDELGSEFNFHDVRVDLRQYLPLRTNHVLAAQVLGVQQAGEVPFSELASIGTYLRGIDPERIRDRSLALLQGEYRLPLRGRVSGVVFGGGGLVGRSLKGLETSSPLWAAGFGLRVAFDPVRRINFRFDVGFSRYGAQPYFQFQEAF
ncbi:BamA/TamA family outer membrane protein [Candidatus Fermentibacteria bacterium]|nr:BamA/TamA family outer membrane protein [Candidatus Fermentibacteria bacterium]